MRNALGNSLNIPAFKAALYVGVPNVVDEYKKFGMTTLDDEGYGPSVTLGGVDVKLVDVTYAYTVLANNGVMRGVPTHARASTTATASSTPSRSCRSRAQDGTVLYPDTEDHRVQVQEEQVVDAAVRVHDQRASSPTRTRSASPTAAAR